MVKIPTFETVVIIVTVVRGVTGKDVSEISISIVLSMDNGNEQDGWASRKPFLGGGDLVLFHYPTKGQWKRKFGDDVATSRTRAFTRSKCTLLNLFSDCVQQLLKRLTHLNRLISG